MYVFFVIFMNWKGLQEQSSWKEQVEGERNNKGARDGNEVGDCDSQPHLHISVDAWSAENQFASKGM